MIVNNQNLGIYIHVPFCVCKCPYCDFYSVVPKNIEIYANSVCREIEKWGAVSKNTVDTIYFGGGTPSLLEAETIGLIIKCIYKNFKVSDPEITIEINPADYEAMDFEKLKKFGVNRVSVGAQSFSEKELKSLGRRHGKNDIVMTVKSLKNAGIKNISLDLMLGIPYQTKENVKNFIDFCTENEIKHVSAYLLKIEKGTKFYINRNNLNLPSDDESAEIYEFAVDYLSKKGYHQYEVSNFSMPNFESKHNLKYWNLEEYIGIGPSAHSLFEGRRFYYKNSLKDFAECPQTHREGEFEPEIEYIMLRMRLSEGLNFEKFKKKFEKDVPQKYLNNAEKYVGFGLLISDKNGIRLTKKGFLLSNFVIGGILE